jgi:hypothetical protein
VTHNSNLSIQKAKAGELHVQGKPRLYSQHELHKETWSQKKWVGEKESKRASKRRGREEKERHRKHRKKEGKGRKEGRKDRMKEEGREGRRV